MLQLGRGIGNRQLRLKSGLVFATLIAGGLALGAVIWQEDSLVARFLSNQNIVASYLRAGGVAGPMWCILIQFLQVVIFVIPGEITQLASGYIFGVGPGFLYAIIGILLGSVFNFYFGRLAGRSTIGYFLSAETIEKVKNALNSNKAKIAVFGLFLLPGTPKDAMCYALGLSAMTVTEFLIITGLARAPALLASVLIGAYASRRNYGLMILVGALVIIAAGICYLYERRRQKGQQSSRPG